MRLKYFCSGGFNYPMDATDGPPPNFNFKYVVWYLLWKSPYDTLGVLQIIAGSILAVSPGLPHPWTAILLGVSGACNNLVAHFKR
jgi:hypothetical protein